ncbi:MAG: GDP-mannose 4,6-dehydratase [Candidatus Lindowbacteria bacterium]|nr:GDP-mannose 4,6-dehydratase [Candidatus Lindowbacteria bacterium]
MRILITGINGFAGSHLVDFIRKEHPEAKIHGLVRRESSMVNLQATKDFLTLHIGELTRQSSLESIVQLSEPDLIFHFAGQPIADTKFADSVSTMESNLIGTVNLLEAVKASNYDPIIVIVSSSNVYGIVKEEDLPQVEDRSVSPASPYALSKASCELAAVMYTKTYGLKCVISRSFNHSGPRRPRSYVDSSFAYQVAQITNQRIPPRITVGNLDAIRSFTDVRDMVRGYWLLAQTGVPGEIYNIGNPGAVRIKDMLDMILKISDFEGSIEVVQDPKLLRKIEVPCLVPCIKKFEAISEWKPTIPYETTLRDMYEYWKKRA